MPVNKNAMTRFQILDELLSNSYRSYSLDDLTEAVNERLAEISPGKSVGRRMIENDIRYLELESPFMVEIERYSIPSYNPDTGKTTKKRCLRYADPSFSIFKKQLSDDETYMLREAFSLLGQFEGLPNMEGLESLRKSLGVEKEERNIISFTKNPLENSNLLGQLFIAIAHRQVIQIEYRNFKTPDISKSICAHPYLLKEYNHRWYLFCHTEGKGTISVYSLDRIEKVNPLTAYIYKEYEGDINEIFEDIIGVTIAEKSPVHHIVFWVSPISQDYVLTKPIHDSQIHLKGEAEVRLRETYTLPKGAFFSIDCKYSYELERELASFGKELLVLAPSDLQDKIWKRIGEMYEEYDKLRR